MRGDRPPAELVAARSRNPFGNPEKRPQLSPESRHSVADEVLRRAQAAVDALSAEYPQHAMRDIARLIVLADRMAHNADGRLSDFDEISRIAHDMRGQGAVFGFPMMTRCAGSLCRATRTLGPDDGAIVHLIRTHIAALYAVLNSRAGADDPLAESVARGLELLVHANTRR